jgi:predicted DNA-binding transcriptional regulator AlpA
MSPEDSCEQRPASARRLSNVSLSRWVNERFPAWEELLSAHDVARLTRRPRWMLLGMMVLGTFPRKQRFHGRAIGWRRGDVLEWVARESQLATCRAYRSQTIRRRLAAQVMLPPRCAVPCASHRPREACGRRGGRRP